MLTLNALKDLFDEDHKAEIGVKVEDLQDANIDESQLARETGRKVRKIPSTRQTTDSTLELVEDYFLFSPKGA